MRLENHLTEVLDCRLGRVYSPSTLQPSRTPGLGDARGAPETATKGPEVVAGPQSQSLRVVASQQGPQKTPGPRDPQPGLFLSPPPPLAEPVIQARREA